MRVLFYVSIVGRPLKNASLKGNFSKKPAKINFKSDYDRKIEFDFFVIKFKFNFLAIRLKPSPEKVGQKIHKSESGFFGLFYHKFMYISYIHSINSLKIFI